MHVSPFWKTVVSFLGALALGVKAALVGDELISPQEFLEIGIALAATLGVFLAPNREPPA